jgi:hypothetical protein
MGKKRAEDSMSPEDLKVGTKISFPFGKGEKEGEVTRVFQKTVYLKVDFPHHPGKRVKRKIDELNAGGKKGKNEKKKKKK